MGVPRTYTCRDPGGSAAGWLLVGWFVVDVECRAARHGSCPLSYDILYRGYTYGCGARSRSGRAQNALTYPPREMMKEKEFDYRMIDDRMIATENGPRA